MASSNDRRRVTPEEALEQLGAQWSPDTDAYASGDMDVSQVRCALCSQRGCSGHEFGTPEYFALLDKVHGRRS